MKKKNHASGGVTIRSLVSKPSSNRIDDESQRQALVIKGF